MSFKTRLSLSIVALVLTSVALLSVVYLRFLLRTQLEIAIRQAELVAQQIQSATMEIIREQSREQRFLSSDWEENRAFWRRAVRESVQMSEILRLALGSFNTIAEIAVTDEKGQVLANPMGREHWASRPALKELAGKGFVEQLRSVYARHRDYETTLTLGDRQPALVIHVAVSTPLLRQELEPRIRNLGLAALASLLASLVFAVVFSRVVFRPLDRLGETIDRMTRGEFGPSLSKAVSKGDEYAAIASKLNVLGQQVRDAREGISTLRGDMEELMRKLEDAVLLFGRDDRLIIASAAAEAFLGLSRRQMVGLKLEEIFPAGTELGTLVQSAARLAQPIQDHLVELVPVPGRPARLLLTVEHFAEGRRSGALVILRDAETRRQIETQVEISKRLAAISRLTGGAAHEIKNPLNAIGLHLELLKNRLAGSQTEPPPELDVIMREIARLNRVVNTFLDFTRPVDLKLTDVHLGKLLEEIAGLAGPEAVKTQVRIRVDDGFPGAVIKADRDLLKQAVLNLAANGIQAMPGGGELKLGLARAGAEVELEVADQGAGIPPEIQDKIFGLYFTTKKEGSGIGLAMAFRVVQLHSGTIDFSSEPGRGTTFRVRFPMSEAK